MQCSCGGETEDHKVQKNLTLVGEYVRCDACGRIHWLWAGPEIDRKEYPLAPEFVTEISK